MLCEPGIAVHVCEPSNWEVEAGEPEVQGHLGKFKAAWEIEALSLKNENKKSLFELITWIS